MVQIRHKKDPSSHPDPKSAESTPCPTELFLLTLRHPSVKPISSNAFQRDFEDGIRGSVVGDEEIRKPSL